MQHGDSSLEAFSCSRKPGKIGLHVLFSSPLWMAIAMLCCLMLCSARAENVVLYLKNGDKLTGFVVSQYTNRLVLSNSWVKDLSIPLLEIERREIAAAPGGTNQPAGTNLLAKVKIASTNATPPRLFKHWTGEAEVGLDLNYSTTTQRTYHGHILLTYEHPYSYDPKLFFRNTTDYTVQYGKTEQTVNNKNVSVTSSDLMGGTDKTSFDLTHRWYVYNLAGAGYDRVRNIDLQIEEGPGAGYHVLTGSNLTMNAEAGADYQIQYQSDDTRLRNFFYRLAENVNWKITPRTTFTEQTEFFPRVDFKEYRVRAEATLSYSIWRYVYLNLSVHDAYDTLPAEGAAANELLVHSALGMKF